MSDQGIKGAIFLAIMAIGGVRYLIKTGNNDTNIGPIDYVIAIGIVILVALINI